MLSYLILGTQTSSCPPVSTVIEILAGHTAVFPVSLEARCGHMTIFWSIIKSICGEFQVHSTIFKHVFSSPLTSQGFHWFLQPENPKHNPLKTSALTFSWWWFKFLAIPRPLHLTPYILVVFVLSVLDQPTLKGKQPANFKQSRTIFLLSSSLYRSSASPHLFPIHL